jgi:hypothetical protein
MSYRGGAYCSWMRPGRGLTDSHADVGNQVEGDISTHSLCVSFITTSLVGINTRAYLHNTRRPVEGVVQDVLWLAQTWGSRQTNERDCAQPWLLRCPSSLTG